MQLLHYIWHFYAIGMVFVIAIFYHHECNDRKFGARVLHKTTVLG